MRRRSTKSRVLRTYYHPANASLAIAGDIDPNDAGLAHGYFGEPLRLAAAVHPAEVTLEG
jgi:predicted Zn-dependent peptidase